MQVPTEGIMRNGFKNQYILTEHRKRYNLTHSVTAFRVQRKGGVLPSSPGRYPEESKGGVYAYVAQIRGRFGRAFLIGQAVLWFDTDGLIYPHVPWIPVGVLFCKQWHFFDTRLAKVGTKGSLRKEVHCA